jgi:phosphate transport system permease protein
MLSDVRWMGNSAPRLGLPDAQALRTALRRTPTGRTADRVMDLLTAAAAVGLLLLAAAIAGAMAVPAGPALRRFGLAFLISQDWNPVTGAFGALPFLYGTVVSSTLALLLGGPVALGTAIALAELVPPPARGVLAALVELLAAIPSVVYGLWGIFVLAPFLRTTVEPLLGRSMGVLPLFSGPPYGVGMLAGGLILAIMIIPTIAAVSRDALQTVPGDLREAMLALGATRWEMIQHVVLPCARSGLIGALGLGLGRALGETMAVTMVIGNRPVISASLFAPGYTLTAVIANEFSEATDDLHLAALMEIGLVLLGLTVAANAVARLLVWRGRPDNDRAGQH